MSDSFSMWLVDPHRVLIALLSAMRRGVPMALLTAGTAVLLLNQAAAGQATIVATASAAKVQVAEPFTLEWTVTASADAKVAFPTISKQFGDFDVDKSTDLFDIPSANSADTRTWTRRLTLESIVTGELTIPELEVQVTDKSGQQVLKSNSLTINVTSVLEERGDPTKFRDIQSVVDVDLPKSRSDAWFWWTVGGVTGLSLLAIVAVTAMRRRSWVTPKAWAFQELGKLETEAEVGSADSETAACKLSDILRTYLLLEFGIAESGHTPEELLQAIHSNDSIGSAASDQLSELFSLADQAKFAGLSLSLMELESALSDARKLIVQIAEVNEMRSRRPQTLEA
ncbi:MAG: hypothetical protein KDA72_00390 [Planctomycetales bacterium]|nr:hypothetical protein [Planctomycetales bacterium]